MGKQPVNANYNDFEFNILSLKCIFSAQLIFFSGKIIWIWVNGWRNELRLLFILCVPFPSSLWHTLWVTPMRSWFRLRLRLNHCIIHSNWNSKQAKCTCSAQCVFICCAVKPISILWMSVLRWNSLKLTDWYYHFLLFRCEATEFSDSTHNLSGCWWVFLIFKHLWIEAIMKWRLDYDGRCFVGDMRM